MITKIKVIGIGGAGSNTISRLMHSSIKNIELISINTDLQDLQKKDAKIKLRIGEKTTQGLGSGMKPEIGALSARENAKEIESVLRNTDIAFLTAGLGGGTGSGAMPVIAELARNLDVLTIGIVSLPFSFEGKKRKRIAITALEQLRRKIDTLVAIPNDKLMELVPVKSSVDVAFAVCDGLLKEAVESISNVVLSPGIFNVDFADIKEVLKDGGLAFFGIGKAQGAGRVNKALEKAIFSPITSFPLEKTNGILFHVAFGSKIYLSEVKKAADVIKKKVPSSAKIIFGASLDKNLARDEIRITVIATGTIQE